MERPFNGEGENLTLWQELRLEVWRSVVRHSFEELLQGVQERCHVVVRVEENLVSNQTERFCFNL